ncbi:MAG: sulfite exporter TauE/SafE family protein [Armatimonadota bacterium]
MAAPLIIGYSFLLGMLHGILPDEHTWPITFSYAIGGASGKAGMKAGLYFSAAFTVQRALLSQISYLALAPLLLRPEVNGVVFTVVGLAMSLAGGLLIGRATHPHPHLLGAKDAEFHEGDGPRQRTVPIHWTLIHGFIAGFGFEGFSVYINTVAAPAMPKPWLGFLPGLVFGLGTMLVLALVGVLFGSFLRWARSLTERQITRIGTETGARTLLYGGLLFILFGIGTIMGWVKRLPVEEDSFLIIAFMVGIAVPAFIYSYRRAVMEKG